MPRRAILNGQPAMLFLQEGSVVTALVLDIVDGLIVGVRVVTNPDKLQRLAAHVRGGGS